MSNLNSVMEKVAIALKGDRTLIAASENNVKVTGSISSVKKLVLGGVLGVLSLFAFNTHSANAVSINFTVNDNEGSVWGTGNFEGFDNNLDQLLTLNELVSFDTNNVENAFLTVGDLFGFGSFNLNTGVWNADGPGWGNPTGSYFSWNGGDNSVNPVWANITTNFTPSVPTPEATSILGLMAVGSLVVSQTKGKKSEDK